MASETANNKKKRQSTASGTSSKGKKSSGTGTTKARSSGSKKTGSSASGSKRSRSSASGSKKTRSTSAGRRSSTKGRTAASRKQRNYRYQAGVFDQVELLIVLAVSVLLILSTFGLAGRIGDRVGYGLFGAFGVMAFVFPYAFFLGMAFHMANRRSVAAHVRILAAALMLMMIIGLCTVYDPSYSASVTASEAFRISAASHKGGGFIGQLIGGNAAALFGKIGSTVILVGLTIVFAVLTTGTRIFLRLGMTLSEAFGAMGDSMAESRERRRAEREAALAAEDEDEEDDEELTSLVNFEKRKLEKEEKRRRRAQKAEKQKKAKAIAKEAYARQSALDDIEEDDLPESYMPPVKDKNKTEASSVLSLLQKGKEAISDATSYGKSVGYASGEGKELKPLPAKGASDDEAMKTYRINNQENDMGSAAFHIPEDYKADPDEVISPTQIRKDFGVAPGVGTFSQTNITVPDFLRYERNHESAQALSLTDPGRKAAADDRQTGPSTGEVRTAAETGRKAVMTHGRRDETGFTVPSKTAYTKRVEALMAGAAQTPVKAEPLTKVSMDDIISQSEIKDARVQVQKNREAQADRDRERREYGQKIDALDNRPAIDPSVLGQVSEVDGLYEQSDAVDQGEMARALSEAQAGSAASGALTAGGDKTAVRAAVSGAGQVGAVSQATVEAEVVEETSENTRIQYAFPPMEFLTKGSKSARDSEQEQYRMAQKLQETLESFGVSVTITGISVGPTVTRYEMQPKTGVKVSRIVNLQDDIKLNLAVTDIRIEAPIPGKSAVGIEVPNKNKEMVRLRDLLESSKMDEAKAKGARLTFAVGKDIGGQVVTADIQKMPHMLIAGATGSGKSVCINTIIMSLLYFADPNDVKLIMVDPKVVELSIYNGIPHLLIPVVTDPKKAAGALNWAVGEMMQRYEKFAQLGTKDIKGYNEKLDRAKQLPEGHERLAQIVIIIDELADLMMVAQSEVEDAICRLAQLARAAGIHLIIATQRPSVNVITGLIKANVPSRVAFAVSSGVDSRTILDSIGAEKLLGNGDMLFYPQGYPKPKRIQGAFVSEDEIAKVVSYINANSHVPISEAAKKITGSIESARSGGKNGDDADRDIYFTEAGRFVIEKEKASIGMLQRVYKIGFNRAARIMDQLCDAGVVGPEIGTKPREIKMSLEEFEAQFGDN